MKYDENQLVLDFARRTKRNLEYIESKSHDNYDLEVYEVTQLINSMLGLLVFPQQKFFDDLPEISLGELVDKGWPKINTTKGKLKEDNLQQLLRYLRNGIAHFNVRFTANTSNKLTGVSIWNIPQGKKMQDWEAELSLDDLRNIVYRFIELIEKKYQP